MRIFKTKTFAKFAKKKQIMDEDLIDAVERANQGLIDANLGGNVIKQRIAKQGQGKSSGYRSLILYRINNNSYFVAAIEKSDRENISEQEENALKLLAKVYETYREEQINALVKQGILIEITLPK
ncbi:type II toxin-antitoxin system RelE/ParE family toxin [Actinobacillus porcinus]|uniref:Uncharacterized protein conserved in bacteria n=1 Tax=Actinobacillus porcinus TaxID=51048 RepID=A0ABY6TJ12_9PAST|nr:type II toxin-antitoxin system RelE/ParE family toxin [Actinobacillus porcinus]MCI5763847.1 type II toxin-antitoxin system RelE/ParE family toxin [Actinobacillus porcinus]MDD7544606.1 type II toxin-antitoxin system RelE/ParE family toxin [Actinobacillus porcinus]MDY5422445.1 type II toxin-antitoxin system RelE/ParE family toxin [Actinobacillus porcinus]MDY5848667.1 type II toxin-antitoxin system RelE/ParE family toxin [Actinobacillus porcinus]MDY6216714.1 type II toxin-antitoxin system RelE